MEQSVKERLKEYLKYSKIKGGDFCNKIGVSSGFISAMRESIQPDKLKSIAINYPNLNIEWLLIGFGEMIKGDNRLLLEEIENLKFENATLKKEIECKDQIINKFFDKIGPVSDAKTEHHSEKSA